MPAGGLPLDVMAAVLGGALLHAGWNVALKAGSDKGLETAALLAGGVVLALVLLPFIGLPAAASYPALALSTLLHVAYFFLLMKAYQTGEMAHLYPLMRGLPPLVLALLGLVWGEALAPARGLGVALISLGVLSLALSRGAAPHGRATLFALLNIAVIAAYTLNDGIGARLSRAPFAYTLATFFATGVLFIGATAFRRGRALAALPRRRWMIGIVAAASAIGSYGLALWAMTRAPIAAIAALRETAILFGMVLARVVVGERLGPVRLAAGALIVGGAVILRLF